MTKAKLPFSDKEACEGQIHRLDRLINRGGCCWPCRDVRMSRIDRDLTGSLGPSRQKHRRVTEDSNPVARQAGTEERAEGDTHAKRVNRAERLLSAVIFSRQQPAKTDKTKIDMSRLDEKGMPELNKHLDHHEPKGNQDGWPQFTGGLPRPG